MATYKAISATCTAITDLLKANQYDDLAAGQSLMFDVYQTKDFETPMENGISLFLYHVTVNQIRRTMPARDTPASPRRQLPQLPLDLHFMLIPWGKSAAMELELLGWAMRVIEDFPSVPISLLDETNFSEGETIEIVPGQLTYEEMFRIWDVLPVDFRVCATYVARIVRIDSQRERGGGIVLERELQFAQNGKRDATT